jgi:15-cis-phytoene synthase
MSILGTPQDLVDPKNLVDPEDLAACRLLLRNGSKSFFAASLLLPHHVRVPATALYAFCRVADDAVDLTNDPASAVAGLNTRLDTIYAGAPADDPVDRALAAVVRSFALPRAHLDALLDGFVWDGEGRRYETIGDLRAYAARVAGTVGVMMTLLMGERSAATLARACDLGVAMQLTNIARDVGEDARNGRVYLPLAWMREAGLDPENWLKSPRHEQGLAVVVQRLLAEAAGLYERSRQGITLLPADCRPAIHAARLVYSDIGAEIARNRHDSVSQRAYVSGPRKLRLLAEALMTGAAPVGQVQPALEEVRFLIDAVENLAPAAATQRASTVAMTQPTTDHPGRIMRMLDIAEKLERSRNQAWTITPVSN